MYVDTHCHIFNEYYDDISSLIDNIKAAGVDKIIVNGCDMNSNLEVLKLVKKYDIVYGALGFQPTELDGVNDDNIYWLMNHINDDKIVAVGEIGLDYHYDNTDKERQINYFKKQLEVASKQKKPIIVHSRNAIQDTYNILSQYKLKGSIHCYSGSLEMANEFIKLGYYLGIGGVVTYNNSKTIKEVVKYIDLKHILLETDSPYLTPNPNRSLKNDPSNLKYISECIASIKEEDESVVSSITNDNACRLFDF